MSPNLKLQLEYLAKTWTYPQPNVDAMMIDDVWHNNVFLPNKGY